MTAGLHDPEPAGNVGTIGQCRGACRIRAGAVEVGERRRLVDVDPAGQIARKRHPGLHRHLLCRIEDVLGGRVDRCCQCTVLARCPAEDLQTLLGRVGRNEEGDRAEELGRVDVLVCSVEPNDERRADPRFWERGMRHFLGWPHDLAEGGCSLEPSQNRIVDDRAGQLDRSGGIAQQCVDCGPDACGNLVEGLIPFVGLDAVTRDQEVLRCSTHLAGVERQGEGDVRGHSTEVIGGIDDDGVDPSLLGVDVSLPGVLLQPVAVLRGTREVDDLHIVVGGEYGCQSLAVALGSQADEVGVEPELGQRLPGNRDSDRQRQHGPRVWFDHDRVPRHQAREQTRVRVPRGERVAAHDKCQPARHDVKGLGHAQRVTLALRLLPVGRAGMPRHLGVGVRNGLERPVLRVWAARLERHDERLAGRLHDCMGELEAALVDPVDDLDANGCPRQRTCVAPFGNARPHRSEKLLHIGDVRIGNAELGTERRLLTANLAVAARHLKPGKRLAEKGLVGRFAFGRCGLAVHPGAGRLRVCREVRALAGRGNRFVEGGPMRVDQFVDGRGGHRLRHRCPLLISHLAPRVRHGANAGKVWIRPVRSAVASVDRRLRPLWLRPNVRSAAPSVGIAPLPLRLTAYAIGTARIGGMMIVGVVGAGTMGSGIAQVAARAGHRTLVFDAEPGRAAKACAEAVAGFERLRARGSLSTDEAAAAEDRLVAVGTLADLAGCGLVVEAIVESLDAKRALMAKLADQVAADATLATNTSSISIDAIAAAIPVPGRVIGMHFFNPAPVMRLVEVVFGTATERAVVDRVCELGECWGKVGVCVASPPGFVVSRVARPLYGDAHPRLEDGAGDAATIDAVMREAGGFRMGPLELTDLIGQDINLAVSRSVWEGTGFDPRYTPSSYQRSLVEAGRLGRKSGHGVYHYPGESPTPATEPPRRPPASVWSGPRTGVVAGLIERAREAGIPVGDVGDGADPRLALEFPAARARFGAGEPATGRHEDKPVVVLDLALDYLTATRLAVAPPLGCPPEALADVVGFLQAAGLAVSVIADSPGLVVTRTVARLANEAVDLVSRGIVSAGEVDTAMQLGANYPIGPLEWGDRIGPSLLCRTLDNLESYYRDGRYRPSPFLRRLASAGLSLRDGVDWPERETQA